MSSPDDVIVHYYIPNRFAEITSKELGYREKVDIDVVEEIGVDLSEHVAITSNEQIEEHDPDADELISDDLGSVTIKPAGINTLIETKTLNELGVLCVVLNDGSTQKPCIITGMDDIEVVSQEDDGVMFTVDGVTSSYFIDYEWMEENWGVDPDEYR